MLDSVDNTNHSDATHVFDIVGLSSEYDSLLPLYSVRTNNVLANLQARYATKEEFLHSFVRMSYAYLCSLKNCGRKTVKEIVELQNKLGADIVIDNAEETSSNDVRETTVPHILPSNIDSLLPLIVPRLLGLSMRARNGFLSLLSEHHDSLAELYTEITRRNFNPIKLKNVGRKTVEEIIDFIREIRAYLERFPDEQSVEEAITNHFAKTLDDIQIPSGAQKEILELEKTLGYFPLFAAVKAYLEGLNGDNRVIIDNLLKIHEDQTIRDSSLVAAEMGLSRERVRQKRNKLLGRLTEYFASYRILGFVNKCPYNYQMHRINEEINQTEDTDFTLHFVNWVLASTFEEITLIGDPVKALSGYYDKKIFVGIVPTDLLEFMDFDAFIRDIEARLSERRINEERVNLKDLIGVHLKTQYCEDEMPAIETACRSLLYLHFPVEVDFGQVIFKPNARKNNPIVIEEIIRAAGHPLTLEEIYEEFIYQYPERYTEMNSLRGGINNNPNIVPISRTSTYSLLEWEGKGIRGGSIRQIVFDFLREHEPTIAPLSEITEHVCQFRPTTDEYNILTNLSLEKSGLFAFFFRDGERYIGLAENTYPIEFFPYAGDARNAVTMSINYPKLIAFIEANGHFPFTSGGDEDEKQLCSFWRRQEHYFKEGELSTSGLSYHTKVLSEYGHLQMDKKEYEWRKLYTTVKRRFELGTLKANNFEEDPDLSKWLSNALHDYRYCKDKMPQWKRDAIEDLMQYFSNSDDVQDNLG